MTQSYGPPSGQPPYDQPDRPDPGTTKRPWFRKKRVLIPVGLLAAFIAIGIVAPAEDEQPAVASSPSGSQFSQDSVEEPSPAATSAAPSAAELAAAAEADRLAAEQAAAAQAQQAADEAAAEEAERVAAEQAAADEAAAEAAVGTVSQQNAYDSAEGYLRSQAFSRSGLVKQLTSEFGEGFPAADAEFAVARLEAESGVDWNEQAAKSAKSYLEFQSFSRNGLIEQLTSEFGEGFTQAQAEYGVSTTGL